MESIVVTGAGGGVGRRVVAKLLEHPRIDRVVALDRAPEHWAQGLDGMVSGDDRLVPRTVDMRAGDLSPLLEGASSIIHLAEDNRRLRRRRHDTSIMQRLLDAASDVGARHLVVLSSALVYGAHPDNPVPLTEAHPIRPIEALMQAHLKAELEGLAGRWAETQNAGLAVLRPTTAFSEDGPSWVAAALRAAITVRPEQVDPPMQFLHHDDLASAAVLAAMARLEGVYNVSADGWIGADAFRALRGEIEVRLPEQLSEVRHRLARRVVDGALLDGLEPYVRYPWVVANDRLRAEGWEPTFSNEESYMAGTAAPLLASLGPRERQEFVLGALGVVGAATAGGALWLRNRVNR